LACHDKILNKVILLLALDSLAILIILGYLDRKLQGNLEIAIIIGTSVGIDCQL
jgi:hypothetical protein